MTFDATDRKAIRKREKRAKQREVQRQIYTRQIMSNEFGREWMWDLLERCHIFSTPFVAGQIDTTSFNCGEQNFGLQLLADIMLAAPNDYALMAQEAQIRNLANDRYDSDYRDPSERQQPGYEEPGRNDEGPVAGEYDSDPERLN